ncbi:hypothetical protein QEH56_17025 [Pelagicoccus enzymogenes]|uniref:hypothetical protein n=1 Tax=Pelagicoccus enzymogenes TaxID=2773457 RepID=UPI0028100F45|nr:hypothetical protein [Pelagicoccus enzymogenes]MDQ8199869.1 hypothetical protein [Pelagicoccus enzymogenes]
MKLYLLQKSLSVRLHWTLVFLLLALQRSPTLKLLLNAKQLQATSPVARILQSIALPAAALSTPHALSGASTSSYDVEYINTPELKVGVEAVIRFQNTITPLSWSLTGDLPPGMRLTDLRLRKSVVDGVIATDIGIITGVPSQAGTFDIVLTPWSNDDGTGDTAPEPDPGALRLSLSVLPAEEAPLVAPKLSIVRQHSTLSLSWQVDAAQNFRLVSSHDLSTWSPVSTNPLQSGNTASLELPLNDALRKFYRLEPEE